VWFRTRIRYDKKIIAIYRAVAGYSHISSFKESLVSKISTTLYHEIATMSHP